MYGTGAIEVWGVCGGSASGKSTLARALRARLGHDHVVTIAHDAYYRDLSHLTFAERCEVNYDHPDALETALLVEHLSALRRGRSVAVPVYDFAAHNRSPDIDLVDPRPLVLVEGILIYAVDELRAQFDRRIFLDVPADVRLQRRLRRDVEDRGRDPDEVRDNFTTIVAPMHDCFVAPHGSTADWVIGHTDDQAEWLDRLVSARPPALAG